MNTMMDAYLDGPESAKAPPSAGPRKIWSGDVVRDRYGRRWIVKPSSWWETVRASVGLPHRKHLRPLEDPSDPVCQVPIEHDEIRGAAARFIHAHGAATFPSGRAPVAMSLAQIDMWLYLMPWPCRVDGGREYLGEVCALTLCGAALIRWDGAKAEGRAFGYVSGTDTGWVVLWQDRR